jgi:amino acid adenylation domain-containing protein
MVALFTPGDDELGEHGTAEESMPMQPAAVRSLIARWNPYSVAPFGCETLSRSFEQQADATPDGIAIQLDSVRVTYRELDERSNQLARILQSYRLEPDSLVAVCFERSLEMIVSMLAILKAGAGYLPIDPSYPPERIKVILEDADPSVVLTQDALADRLPKTPIATIRVDAERASITAQDARRLAGIAGSENVAYVIYTSGSTGKPKGVMVTHRNVVRLLKSTEPWFRFGSTDVWTLFHSSAFDFSVWEIWGCLLTGGRLVVVPHWITRSPRDFYSLLAHEQVTVLNQTPAAFYQIIQVEESELIKPLSLRYVIFGGEALNFVNLRPWFQRHGDRAPQLINMYGITETTVHVTYRPVTAADSQTETRSLIGAPIPDVRLYLLDPQQRPVPPGAVGEIYVGGAGVARGYLNRPELTAERFVADPFAEQPDALMYKSGDLARLLDHGDIEYLGRGDMQVKIRGFRIELGEIEATLAEHPAVRQAVVVARKDGPGEPRLVSYFVKKTDRPPATNELREFLHGRLPAHMVPYAYVELEALPLTVNGKIDRAALPAPGIAPQTDSAVEAAGTQLEQTILDVWRKTLGTERIGVSDNFFDLGGDSLLLVTVRASLQKALQIEIPTTALFEFTTVRSLARHLGDKETASPSLSDAQQRAQKQRAAFARQRERRMDSAS